MERRTTTNFGINRYF